MKSLLRNLIVVALLVVCASRMSAAEYGTFESFYSSGGLGFWDWTFIVGGTIAVAVLTFVTFGGGAAAAPAWIATVGTWIGSTVGLSGIAAANFGLALLGGGAVAAGGLGVAGGVAVLTAMMTFGVDMAVTYGTDAALEKWSHDKFVEANVPYMTANILYHRAKYLSKSNSKEAKKLFDRCQTAFELMGLPNNTKRCEK